MSLKMKNQAHLSREESDQALHPFLMVIDDGARPYLVEDGQKRPVPMESYELVLDLARDFNTCIPIAYTFRYLDYDNVSGLGGCLPYARELASFMTEYRDILPIYHHGLTHGYLYEIDDWEWVECHAEFYNLNDACAIPAEVQEKHLTLCDQICESLNLTGIDTFVPPCHAWEPGVTDRFLAKFGIKKLITVPDYRFGKHRYAYQSSHHLEVLPRKSLAIHHAMTEKALDQDRLQKALNEVLPMPLKTRLRYYRTFKNPWLHSYYLHITNFYPETRDFWYRFFESLEKRNDIVLPSSDEEAYQLFQQGLVK